MAIGSTQPLTEMSTSDISWSDNLPNSRDDCLETWECQLSRTLRACAGIDLRFYINKPPLIY
jgi:hypothetical protein